MQYRIVVTPAPGVPDLRGQGLLGEIASLGIRGVAEVRTADLYFLEGDLDEVAKELGANVIAFGHTADDFCESFLRNALFTGRVASLPPVTWSRVREFRLIRPLVFVTEEATRACCEQLGAPLVPCGCSQKTGTVRATLRDMMARLQRDYPHLKETMLAALGNVETGRLLDPRYLELDGLQPEARAGAQRQAQHHPADQERAPRQHEDG